MQIDVLTIFPGIFASPLRESLLHAAQVSGKLTINVHNLRDYARDRHRTVDDVPYGGGHGMVMKPEPIFEAVDAITAGRAEPTEIILMSPQGQPFTQAVAWELAEKPYLLFICGRYEGVDERVRLALATRELSIGDYVLNGGELPALVVIEAVSRLLPGVVGDPRSVLEDSFSEGLLEGPQYTRPREYRGMTVPDVLLSGHHEEIRRWRRKQALLRTKQQRPDLWAAFTPTAEDLALLED